MIQHDPRNLVLDQPCSYCRLLELNDLEHGGIMRHDLDGDPYVDFGQVQETKEMRAEAGLWNLGAARALSHVSKGGPEEFDKLKIIPKYELKLGYKRHDIFPSLPGLTETALQGCVFCKVLRDNLISATIREDQDASAQDISTKELSITEITYQFRDTEAKHDGNENTPKVWLDSLYVYFTINSGVDEANHSLHYNFSTDSSDACAKWFSLGRLPTPHDRLSTPSLTRMRQLIDRSLQENPYENKNGFLPTRLLDLQAGCASGLRLIVTQEDPDLQRVTDTQRRYAALSYCWGPPADAALQLKTTHDTLTLHKSEIELDKVPRTISDAIKVCRRLDIRYLWVDALCIIQGDLQDWSKESFEMSQIYSNSFLALCIVEGDSCLSGFLGPSYTPPMVQIGFQSRINSAVSGRLYLRMLSPPREMLKTSSANMGKAVGKNADDISGADFDGAAWGTRGWTFQEEELSPRKLYFGKHMFYISSGKSCEAADGSKFSRESCFQGAPYGTTLTEVEITLSNWYKLVNAYVQRKLSFEQDKFPALSALARSVCDRSPEQRYLAGLWASDLYRGLLWTTTSWMPFEQYYQPPDAPYVAPSWSWACRPLSILNLVCGVTSGAKFCSEIALVRDDIVTEKENPFGLVTSARLIVRGKVFKPPLGANGRIRVDHGKRSKYLGSSIVMNYVLWSENDEYIAHLTLDWDYNSAQHDDCGYPRGPIDELSLLLVSSTTMDQFFMFQSYDLTNQEVVIGVLIRTKPGMDNEYEKLGLWFSETKDLGGKKFWENIPVQELTLS